MEFLPSHPMGSTWDGGSLSHLSSQGSHLFILLQGRSGEETRRAWAQGHRQHQVSFHLYKDSLTPEHINTLNDRERSWDSRPAPPLRLPSPPLPSGPIFSVPSLSCLSPSVSCLFSLSFLLPLSPLCLVWCLPFLLPLSSPPVPFFLLPQSPQPLYTH